MLISAVLLLHERVRYRLKREGWREHNVCGRVINFNLQR